VYLFFTRKLSLTSKGEVEDGRHIDTNIGKEQVHNTKKSLSIFGAESNSRIDPMTPRNTKVLSTYVTQPCDSHEPNTQMVGYTTIDVEVIVPDNQPPPSLQ
jgi:hypothetical protein